MNFILLGKPNVGKSSIFNILTKSNSNIVHKDEGTTRDWHKGLIKSNSIFNIYDTPGLIIKNKTLTNFDNKKILFKNLLSHIKFIFYVIDYKTIFDPSDLEAINRLRKFNKKILLIINKFDNYNINPNPEIHQYGIINYFLISCTHKYGFNKLIEFIDKNSKNISIKKLNTDFSLALFGKPNVGKSTFLNTLIGYERSMTSKYSGTTSDYVEENFKYKNKLIKIIDTAGIQKKSNIKKNSLTFLSTIKTLEKIKKVDASIIIFDSQNNIERQDKRIINIVSKTAKSLILIFNKIDLIKDKFEFKKKISNEIFFNIKESKNIKILYCSAFSKSNVNKIFNYIYESIFIKDFNISTGKLNKWLKIVTSKKEHPLINKRKINFKYAVQVNTKPLTIKIFCNYNNKIKNDYKRFLLNQFNIYFKVVNQKTRLIFSSSKNPFI
tara:strand:+ start:181 stop:1494 length:1314 start_codon:yes stop_codon:yes gene_type:complete